MPCEQGYQIYPDHSPPADGTRALIPYSWRLPKATDHRVNPPTPAIVTQNAVRPLPRWALMLLCIAYVVPGFVGRAPWKSADITAYGYMLELAQGRTSWLNPLLGGMAPETEGLLPYWIGALAIQWELRRVGVVMVVLVFPSSLLRMRWRWAC